MSYISVTTTHGRSPSRHATHNHPPPKPLATHHSSMKTSKPHKTFSTSINHPSCAPDSHCAVCRCAGTHAHLHARMLASLHACVRHTAPCCAMPCHRPLQDVPWVHTSRFVCMTRTRRRGRRRGRRTNTTWGRTGSRHSSRCKQLSSTSDPSFKINFGPSAGTPLPLKKS